MPNNYILFTRRTHKELLAPAKEYTSQASAEEAGNHIYNELSLDTVVVAEAWFEHKLGKVCYNVVFKRIRTCKHPNIQGDLFEGLLCADCGVIVKRIEPAVIVSKIETIPQEITDPEDEEEDEESLVEITDEYNKKMGRVG